MDDADFIEEARQWLSETQFFKVYLFTSTSLSIIEAILVAFPPSIPNLLGQQIILAISTGLFIAIVCAIYSFVPHHANLSPWFKLKHIMTIENIFEFFTLIIGWVFIFIYPGLAVLRCLRLFRFLWYFEFISAHPQDTLLVWILHCFQRTVDYLEKMFEDTCTRRTPGGMVVLMMFFYVCYVFGASLWVYTQGIVLLQYLLGVCNK